MLGAAVESAAVEGKAWLRSPQSRTWGQDRVKIPNIWPTVQLHFWKKKLSKQRGNRYQWRYWMRVWGNLPAVCMKLVKLHLECQTLFWLACTKGILIKCSDYDRVERTHLCAPDFTWLLLQINPHGEDKAIAPWNTIAWPVGRAWGS